MVEKTDLPSDDSSSPTVELSQWVESLKWEDIPENVKTRARYLILDGITCSIVGAHLPWTETAVKAVSSFESPGNCAVIGWKNVSLGPLPSALLNSTLIQSFELDDYHSYSPLHSNSILLPALLALVSQSKANKKVFSGKQFLLATIAGFEIGPRVGLALGGGTILSRGWHSGTVFGPAASAGASSKLLNLDAIQIEDAFGIACTQACGLMSAQFESSVKRMQHGFASRNGLFAALMAEQSYKGISKVFEREYGGFLNVFSNGGDSPMPEQLVKDLSKSWETLNINAKAYPCMAGIHATIDALYELFNRKPVLNANDSISSVKIEMSEPVFKHGGWEATKPLTVIGAQMNDAYICAVILLDGELKIQCFSDNNINREEIWSLLEKIEVVHNKDFDKLPRQHRMCTKVTVNFSDGDSKSTTILQPTGVKAPLSNEQLVDKFHTLTKGLIADEEQQKILQTVLDIEDSEDISDLIEVLKIDIKNPLA